MNLRRFSFLLLLALVFYFLISYWHEHRYDAFIRTAAHRYLVDPALVRAVIWRESRFNPDAHGRAGELGLMQIRATAAQEWAAAEHQPDFQHEMCLDPLTNALAGTWYLNKLLRRYQQSDNPLPYALADYNAGRGNVLKWRSGNAATNSEAFMSQIAFPGTKAYIKAIMHRYHEYQ